MGRAEKAFKRQRRRRTMRVIRLNGSDDAKRAYQHLHAALRATEVRGIEQIRRVGKMMDRLEAIGTKEHRVEKDEAGNPVASYRYVLKEGGGDFWMDDSEFGELRTRMNAVPWQPDHARYVAKTFDMLEAAPEEDPTKPQVVEEK